MYQHRIINRVARFLVAYSLLSFNLYVLAEPFDNNRIEINRGDSAVTNPVVITSISTFKAGEQIPAHFHNGIETAYVIQGAKFIKSDGDISKMNTGDTIFNLQNHTHGGLTIAPGSELKLFTVHIVDKNLPIYNFEKK